MIYASIAKFCLVVCILVAINVYVTLLVMRHYSTGSIDVHEKKYKMNTDMELSNKVIDIENMNEFVSANNTRSVFDPSLSFPDIRHGVKNDHVPTLPMFANDYSDFAFGSIIERSFDSHGPFVTTFFMCHYLLIPYLSIKSGIDLVDPNQKEYWQKTSKRFQSFELTKEIDYELSGKRISKYDYTCRIRNSIDSPSYIVKGYFLPNRLSVDSNANKKFDILRCPIQDAVNATNALKYSNHEIQVEIFWSDVMILNFTIPWRARRTGYMLHSPTHASQIDAWSNLADDRIRNDTEEDWSPIVQLSVPSTYLLPSRKNAAVMLEFISHHLLSYIYEGKLTIYSCNGNSSHSISSSNGMLLVEETTKLLSSTMSLYYAKGFADYIAVFDIDEFFIPKLQYNSIVEVMRAVDLPPNRFNVLPGHGISGAIGFPDKQQHPLCLIRVRTEVVAQNQDWSSAYGQTWLGQRFPHSPEYKMHGAQYDPYAKKGVRFGFDRLIFPTRKMYQIGSTTGGACRLDWQWTPCANDTGPVLEFCERGYGIPDRVAAFHRFDEAVGLKKLKTVDPTSIAVIYHYMLYHQEFFASSDALSNKSVYHIKYFPYVLLDMQKRGLDFILSSN